MAEGRQGSAPLPVLWNGDLRRHNCTTSNQGWLVLCLRGIQAEGFRACCTIRTDAFQNDKGKTL